MKSALSNTEKIFSSTKVIVKENLSRKAVEAYKKRYAKTLKNKCTKCGSSTILVNDVFNHSKVRYNAQSIGFIFVCMMCGCVLLEFYYPIARKKK